MHTINYSNLRQNLARAIDKVNEDHEPMLITRQNGNEAVLMSYEDYKSIEETLYLLSNPVNADRLLRSISEVESGKVIKRDIK